VPYVLVISHERSGTHIAIDAIRNNFSNFKAHYYLNIDRLAEGHHQHCEPEVIERKCKLKPRVIKTHMTPDTRAFFGGGVSVDRLVDEIIGQARQIYVYRDGRDVMASLYTFWSRTIPGFSGTTFSDMLRGHYSVDTGRARTSFSNPISYWKQHVGSWLQNDNILALSFEDFVHNYDITVEKVGQYLGMRPSEPIKSVVRQGSGVQRGKIRETISRLYWRKIRGIEITSVSFNKGGDAGHRSMYSDSDLAFFDGEAGALLAELGYLPWRSYQPLDSGPKSS